MFIYGRSLLSRCYCTALLLIYSKLLPQLENALDFGHMSGFHCHNPVWLGQQECMCVCVRYSPGCRIRLWFMLWLSVRLKITSEFSWASLKCDWQWPPLHWAPLLLPTKHFSVWGNFLLTSHTNLSEAGIICTPMAIFPPQIILSALLLRESEVGHLLSQVSAFVVVCVDIRLESGLAVAVWLIIKWNNWMLMVAEIVCH